MNQAHEPALLPLTEADFAALAALAHEIWHEHYVGIVAPAQLDYMLAGRYTPERLSTYLPETTRWLRLLKRDGRLLGYCSYALTDTPGELKLEQLYLHASQRGQGLGRLMLRHVHAEAIARGCSTLMLTVNRGNAKSLAVYRHCGFVIREAAVFDIGNGYVMDDFVMVKPV